MSQDCDFNVYSDAHRMFVQAMMSRGIIDSKAFKSLFQLCLKRSGVEVPEETEDIAAAQRDFLKTINDKIEDTCGLKIVKAAAESSRSKRTSLVLVNQNDRSCDPNRLTINAMVTFTALEREYIRLILDRIMEDPRRELPEIVAINLGREVKSKKLGSQAAENVINKLKQEKWILDSSKVRLSTRFIVEMEHYLRKTYRHLDLSCSLCRKIVIRSVGCNGCEAQFHMYCAAAINDKCHECKSSLSQASSSASVNVAPSQSLSSQQGNRKRARATGLEEDSE